MDQLSAKWQITGIMNRLLETVVTLRDDPNHSREEAVKDLLKILEELEDMYNSVRW